jgi:hypothetical protein
LTQFLVCVSEQQPAPIAGLCFRLISPDEGTFSSVCLQLQSRIKGFWVAASDDALEAVLNESCDAMDGGNPFGDTSLGRVVLSLTQQASALALFYSSFPEDLPVASNVSELMSTLESQLQPPRAMGPELYIVWRAI